MLFKGRRTRLSERKWGASAEVTPVVERTQNNPIWKIAKLPFSQES